MKKLIRWILRNGRLWIIISVSLIALGNFFILVAVGNPLLALGIFLISFGFLLCLSTLIYLAVADIKEIAGYSMPEEDENEVNENVERDKCVNCEKPVPYAIDTPPDERDYYMDGVGQYCKGCYPH